MVRQSIILEIEKLLDNKKIIDSKLLSDSFGINCLKIITNDNKEFIVKYYYIIYLKMWFWKYRICNFRC